MTAGAVRFVRYAYPPNALGYCGPSDSLALFEYATSQVSDGGLAVLARDFEGAWPYLELIAHANGKDPLAGDVVEAYWIGNRLLDRVDISSFGHAMEERFRSRAGRSWDALVDAVVSGIGPHHGFHVFCVYPWVGLMRTGSVSQPLQILDRCRIRWGTVQLVQGDRALVASQGLVFERDALALGSERVEEVAWARDGHGFSEDLQPGDLVSMHWDWVCERIPAQAADALRRGTDLALGLANQLLARPHTGVLV